MSTNEMTQDQLVRIEALRLAIMKKKDVGSRYTIHTLAHNFEKYIASGVKFGDI